ncbi:MAG TPA: response regulator [Balneolaceae bacterium]|nr:response regulator [Balneolaceae bacterium]
MELNSLIVDDESTSRLVLAAMVENNSNLNLVGTAASGPEALEVLNVEKVDIIFLDVIMPQMSGFDLLDKIADNQNVNVILVTGKEKFAVKAFDYAITDYLVKPVSKNRFNKAVSRVLDKITAKMSSSIPNNLLLIKLIRFLYTRSIDIYKPIPSREALLGYSFPMLTDNLDFDNEARALDLLNEAESNEILSGTFHDTIYLCNSCSNSYLNIREVCPNCNSSNLESNDLIHHFSCAFMGEIDKFKKMGQGGNLVCPKCERKLKHIGVDYDKPSVIFNCRNCDHSFQDPMLRAKCLNCGNDQKVEHLEKRVIKKYRLTSKGIDMAEGNRYVEMRGPSQEDEVTFFKKVLADNIKKKSIVDFDSTLGIFHLRNIRELFNQIGESGREKLIEELHSLLISEMEDNDELAFLDNETILILFSTLEASKAKQVLDRISARITRLINDNFSDFKLDIEGAVHPIGNNHNYNELLNILLRKINTGEGNHHA